MDLLHIFRALLVLIFTAFSSQAQIESGKVTPPQKPAAPAKDTVVRKPKIKVENPATSLYFGAGFGMATRTLTENEGLFAEPLGERASETPIFTNSYFIGLRSRLHGHFYLDFGLSSAKNGEAYSYSQPDSTFSYVTTYRHFAVPVRIQYISGGDFKLIAGVGLQPQMFLKYRQEQEWTDTKGIGGSATVSSKDGYTQFTIAALANVGFQWQFGSNASLFVLPQAAWQLNSSLSKQSPYVHKGIVYAVQVGLVFGVK
jgi:hypothetical protein